MATQASPRPHINRPLRTVGVLGPEWSQIHLAFVARFGQREHEYKAEILDTTQLADKRPNAGFERLLAMVCGDATPSVQCCLLPFYNSSSAFLHELCSLFTTGSVFVVNAFDKEVQHCLAVRPEVNGFSEIEAIYSQTNVFKQCDKWLIENLRCEQREVHSSSEAAIIVKRAADHKYAALASPECATHHGLKILHPNAQKDNNITAFFEVANRKRRAEGNPYIFYAVHMNSATEISRVDDLIETSGFAWTPLWDYLHSSSGHWYAFQIHVDSEEKLLTFHAKLNADYKKFVQFGRIDGRITRYLKHLERFSKKP